MLEGPSEVVIADFEAGLGTLTRVKPGDVDVLVVVAEPTVKSVEVARRGLELIRANELGRSLVVANRVRSSEDRALVERGAGCPVDAVFRTMPPCARPTRGGVRPSMRPWTPRRFEPFEASRICF